MPHVDELLVSCIIAHSSAMLAAACNRTLLQARRLGSSSPQQRPAQWWYERVCVSTRWCTCLSSSCRSRRTKHLRASRALEVFLRGGRRVREPYQVVRGSVALVIEDDGCGVVARLFWRLLSSSLAASCVSPQERLWHARLGEPPGPHAPRRSVVSRRPGGPARGARAGNEARVDVSKLTHVGTPSAYATRARHDAYPDGNAPGAGTVPCAAPPATPGPGVIPCWGCVTPGVTPCWGCGTPGEGPGIAPGAFPWGTPGKVPRAGGPKPGCGSGSARGGGGGWNTTGGGGAGSTGSGCDCGCG